MAESRILVAPDPLRDFVAAIFRAVGFSEDHARTEADVLVWANLRGVDSHGIFRIPMYLSAIESGRINPAPDLRVISASGALRVMEADRAAGPVAMTFAMEQAIEAAASNAIGWVVVRDTTHTGPVGYYARIAAQRDMIGIVMSSSRPIMAYHGTRTPAVSTNPLAIAVPRAGAEPLTLDMATAAIAWGKLSQARRSGAVLPDGVALDSDGRATSDGARAALPLPLAGAKGAGLSLMIECLSSLLAGAPLVAPALGGQAAQQWQHGAAIALDIAAFTDVGGFGEAADELAAAIKAEPVAEGFDEILMPGERGDRVLADRTANGIPLDAGEWRELLGIAERHAIAPPATTPATAG